VIGRCRLIAIEGTHGTGKTTLAHALTARLKREHHHAAQAGESARESPFLETVVVHGRGAMDISAELHIFASQIVREQLQARHLELLVCDKSVVNVLAYARLVLAREDPTTTRLLAAMHDFCRSYVALYDVAFLVSDRYELGRTADPYRPRDGVLRDAVERELVAVCAEVGLSVAPVPAGVGLERQVDWMLGRLDAAGLLAPRPAGR
jgi:nicotinamide riboside kinase